MYFEDLSHYTYYLPKNHEFENVINIGWLDNSHLFPTGVVEPAVVTRLEELICETRSTKVNIIRGQHPCNLCGKYREIKCKNNKISLLGSSELWIPSADDRYFYAAPSLILHYIEEHLYLPPIEFQEAVLNFNEDKPFDGQQIYEELFDQLIEGTN